MTDKLERCEILGAYIIRYKATVRDAALRYGVSKSTVHKDVTERLSEINTAMYSKVRTVLEENKAERHIRGGEATKHKYEATKKETVKSIEISHFKKSGVNL